LAAGYSNEQGVRTMAEDFSDRFRYLKDPEALQNIFATSMEELRRTTPSLVSQQGDTMYKLPRHGNRTISTLSILLRGSILYEPYGSAVVHGDLHFENVVFARVKGWRQFFFIDFAHSGLHNVFFDHIVMEMGCRFQLAPILLNFANEAIDDAGRQNLYDEMLKLEIALVDRIARDKKADCYTGKLKSLFDLICVIRGAAATRWPSEPPERYLAAVGLTSAAAIRLKLPTAFQQLCRVWFSIASAINLTEYEKHRAKHKACSPASLWNYRTEETPDERLQAAVLSRTHDLTGAFLDVVKGRLLRAQSSGHKANYDSGLYRAELELIRARFPRTFEQLGLIYNEWLISLTEQEAAIARDFGEIGMLFALHKLSELMEVPTDLKNAVETLETKLNAP